MRGRLQARLRFQAIEDEELIARVKDAVGAAHRPDPAVRFAWVDHVLLKDLLVTRRHAYRWAATSALVGTGIALLGALSAVAGALGKGLSQGNAWSVAGLAAGSLVTALAGYRLARKPDQQRSTIDLRRHLLRRTGWDYVNRRPPFDDDDEDLRYGELVDEVFRLRDIA
jgi:hypothetical protein